MIKWGKNKFDFDAYGFFLRKNGNDPLPPLLCFTNNFHNLESFLSAGEIVDQIGWKVSDDFWEIDKQDEVF